MNTIEPTALRLYVDRFWISPYAYSAFVALKEKGVTFETAVVNLATKEQLAPDYRDRSLTARVPALEHGALWLSESSAIVEYVDEAFSGAPLLPRDVVERARARQVMSWLRSDLAALREDRASHTIFYARATAPLSAGGRAAADKLVRVAAALLPDGRTQLFSTWSVADADLAFMLMRLVANGDDAPARLRAYAEAQWARPSVRAWVEHARPPYVPYR